MREGDKMDELKTESLQNIISTTDVLLPQCSFSMGKRDVQNISVFYISDIHLDYHVDKDIDVKCQIKQIVSDLFTDKLISMIERESSRFIVVFGGDIAFDIELNRYFFYEFHARWNYILYRKWHRDNNYQQPLSLTKAKEKYEENLYFLNIEYEKVLKLIRKSMRYDKRHEKMKASDIKENIRKKQLPEYLNYHINHIKHLELQIKKFQSEKSCYIDKLRNGKRYAIKKMIPVFFVLGNHELHAFSTVENSVNYYNEMLSEIGIRLLHNTCISSESIFGDDYWYRGFLLLGGTGFAKYNTEYNADTVIGAEEMSREDEIVESEKFYQIYQEKLIEATDENIPLIVMSHYPLKDWLPNMEYSSHCIYFTGHTHRNESIHTETINVYANNQIGYDKKDIKFKHAKLGLCYNPFIEYVDGLYEITTEQYLDFYDYCNDSLGGTGQIDRQLESGNAKLYMIKKKGFYGFFVMNQKTGAKLCIGGTVRNIGNITDIRYYEASFEAMINQYIIALLPYRKFQEKISGEVKELGYEGKIHGCIVDLDYSHHIMINPMDGQVTYYYSPKHGFVLSYQSIKELILNMPSYGVSKWDVKKEYALLMLDKMSDDKDCLICRNSNELTSHINQMIEVDIKNSLYSVSRRMKQLQRLFDSNVLRDWNEEFASKSIEDVYTKKE